MPHGVCLETAQTETVSQSVSAVVWPLTEQSGDEQNGFLLQLFRAAGDRPSPKL